MKLKLDKILTDRCDLYEIDQARADSYGQRPSLPDVALATDLPCRLLPIKGPREFKVGKRLSIGTYNIYIMPWQSEDGSKKISEHLWIKVGSRLFNIIEALPPVISGAPFELTVEEINP